MKFLKKVSQPINQDKLNKQVGYEIKTFTTNFRNRSPMAQNSYYARRSSMKREQKTIDSGGGEISAKMISKIII